MSVFLCGSMMIPSVVLITRRIALFTALFSVLLIITTFYTGLEFGRPYMDSIGPVIFEGGSINNTFSSTNRKLLGHAKQFEPTRIWGDKCSKSDIVINQGPTAPLPNGIPTYTVEIMNVCVTGCDITGIHLSCGWFSSARLINPRIFKRLRYDDCLVNDGKPLSNGHTISFQYANTFLYPLYISSINC